MKQTRCAFLILLSILTSTAFAESKKAEQPVVSEPTPTQTIVMSRPNTLSAELLGRGGYYSLNYDRSLSESVGVGIGLSVYSAVSDDISASILLIPVYLNYYFSPNHHRPFLTAGLDIAHVSASTSLLGGISGTGALPLLGGGYEFRGDSGFLFRGALYLLVYGQLSATAGLSVGFTY